MKKAAIFDMDGLLFDTELVFNQAWKIVAENHGVKFTMQMLDSMRGTSGKMMKEILESFFPECDGYNLIDELFETSRKILKEHVPVKPGVIELLKYFDENKIPMAIASGSPKDLIENNLEVSKLSKYFKIIVSGDDVKQGKPHPEIFEKTAKLLGYCCQDCYVLEDGLNGVKASLSAGTKTIMVPDLVEPTSDLYEKDVLIFNSLHEVLNYLKDKENCG